MLDGVKTGDNGSLVTSSSFFGEGSISDSVVAGISAICPSPPEIVPLLSRSHGVFRRFQIMYVNSRGSRLPIACYINFRPSSLNPKIGFHRLGLSNNWCNSSSVRRVSMTKDNFIHICSRTTSKVFAGKIQAAVRRDHYLSVSTRIYQTCNNLGQSNIISSLWRRVLSQCLIQPYAMVQIGKRLYGDF